MLVLNERVGFKGELCQIVAVSPAGGNTIYKLKHVESDKVLDGDFIEDDLEKLDPKDAADLERDLQEKAKARLRALTGDTPTSAGSARDQRLEAMFPPDVKPPVREEKVDGTPPAPDIPGLGEDTVSRVPASK